MTATMTKVLATAGLRKPTSRQGKIIAKVIRMADTAEVVPASYSLGLRLRLTYSKSLSGSAWPV